MTDDLLYPEQMAELARCSVSTIKRDLRTGLLRGVKRGRDWVTTRQLFLADLEKLAELQAQKKRAPKVSGKRRRKLVAIP